MNLNRAEGDLWKMTWHFSITANRIRKVMNCHWRFWYLLLRKTICEQYLQPAVAIYGWQSCLIFSTQNLHYLFYRLVHPGLSSFLSPAAALQESETAGDAEMGWMSIFNKKEKTQQEGGLSGFLTSNAFKLITLFEGPVSTVCDEKVLFCYLIVSVYST